MKRLLFLVLMITLISKGHSEVNTKSSYYGSWLSFDYLESLAKTRNIYQTTHDFEYEILMIDPKFRKNESINIYRELPCQSEHSGFKSYEIRSDSILSYVGYFFDPKNMDYTDRGKHSLKYSETQDIIEIIYSDKLNNKKFIRLTNSISKDKIQESFRKKINELVIVGEYLFDNMTISFNSNGEISGFKNYERYKLNLDYCFDSSLYDKISVIEFFQTTDHERHEADNNLDNKFAIEIKNNKVMLYRIILIQTDDYYGIVKGELVHQFFKNTP